MKNLISERIKWVRVNWLFILNFNLSAPWFGFISRKNEQMTDPNPYAAPKTHVQDSVSTQERPMWVWIILAFYVFGVIGSAATYAVIISGSIDIPEEQQKLLANMSAFDHVMGFSILVLRLVAAIQLVRLRKISVLLFPAALLISVLYFGWQLATKGADIVMANASLAGQMIAWTISLSICLYAWRLRKLGVVK